MSWLDNYSTTNTFRSMYINGFIDISGGRLQTRSVTDGHLFIAGDTSLNGNLYVGGDISWNPTSLANDSIPSSAIIGGAVGATGPAGPVGSNTERMLLDCKFGSANNDSTRLYNLEWNIHGTADFLADTRALRSQHPNSGNNSDQITDVLTLSMQPGVYKVTFFYSATYIFGMSMGFDLDHDRYLGHPNNFNQEDGTYVYQGQSSTNTAVFTYIVPSVTNFSLCCMNNVLFRYSKMQHPQILFERVGIPPADGQSDQVLTTPLGVGNYNSPATSNDYTSITGGIYWSGTVTKPTDSNEYIDISESGTEWIYRIDTNSTSSVEVASFHSDADLSLNKRLFVGEDASLNGNLYVGGDISWNPNNLADNSIPSSAIIGGVGGASGPADILLLDATNHPNNSSYGLSQMDYKMSGSVDMLASPYTKRFNLTHGGKYYRGFSLLFRPGVYSLIVNFRIITVGAMYFMFDLDNDRAFVDDPATLYDSNITSGQVLSFKRTYTVTHDSNFYFIERNNSTVHSYDHDYPQFKFERIGHVEPSGTDDTLDIPVGNQGTTLTDTKLIEGGIYWNSSTSNPPPTGYEPSNHTSQGGTNEWAVVEQAANNSQQVLAWVHRINTNSTSSVEVASFHSDADLSLNKRLFVGEDVTLNKRLFVGEDVSLNGNLYVDGGLDMNNNNILNCTNINTSAINGLAPATVNTRFIIGNLAYSAYNSFLSLGDLFGETGQALQKNIPANIGDPNFVWTEERTFYWCNNPSYRVMQCAVSSNNTYYGVVLTPGVWKIKFNIGEVQTNSTTTFSMSFFIDNNNNGQLNDVAGGGSNQQQKARYVTVKGASDYHAVPQVDFTLTVGAPGIPSGGEVNSGYAKIMGIIGANGFFKPLTGFGSWSIECEQLQAFTWNGLYNGFTPPADRTPYGAGSNFSTAGSWTIAVCN